MLACVIAVSLTAVDHLAAAETAVDANRRLSRSMNMGNALEARREGRWGMTIEDEYFDVVKQAGFSAVRIPIRWSAHSGAEPPYAIDPAFMDRVDHVVTQARARDLAVIVNVHHFNEMNRNPADQLPRLLAIWQQIAEHFADRTDGLYFELFNEPMGALDKAWPEMYPQVIETIRGVTPERIIIVGGTDWNSIKRLDDLKKLSGAKRTIATFHYYLPFNFTHQGAPWVDAEHRPPLGAKWGIDSERETIRTDFAEAAQWSEEHHLPLLVGEFGAYDTADMDSRIRWTRTVVQEAERNHMSWAYWEFGAGGFEAYDPQTGSWNQGLLDALIKQ